MQRYELEHIIRAAGSITGADEIVVIGSQSILGAVPNAPAFLLRSMEADVFTFRDSRDADLIDGSIGEGSPFHETFGYYAQGVWIDTAVLPEGWKERLVEVCNENTRGVRGKCLCPHDLAVSKLVAGREKDLEFVGAMIDHGLLDPATMASRFAGLPAREAMEGDPEARWKRLIEPRIKSTAR